MLNMDAKLEWEVDVEGPADMMKRWISMDSWVNAIHPASCDAQNRYKDKHSLYSFYLIRHDDPK